MPYFTQHHLNIFSSKRELNRKVWVGNSLNHLKGEGEEEEVDGDRPGAHATAAAICIAAGVGRSP